MAAAESQKDLTGTVANHYNQLQESGLEERGQSRIFYQRNFNNWIKSMAISDTLMRVRKNVGPKAPITVLDLGAGKGGDMLKWKKGEISKLICADIADLSVQQCESRYKELVERSSKDRFPQNMFTAEFIAADCTKQRLKDVYKDKDVQFDVVSSQFSFHYCFESLPQAEMMLRNACECLKPGGYFIGTTPDAYELVKRLRAADGMSFGNEVYRVTFETENKESLPLFGAKYDFHLEGVVSCPEFLVYFPLLEKMAEKYNMKLVYRIPFAEFYSQHVATAEGRSLIGKMSALEPYPPDSDTALVSKDEISYEYAKQYVERLNQAEDGSRSNEGGYSRDRRRPFKVGTLSLSEWEASSLYVVYAFQRCPDAIESQPESLDGTPASCRKRRHDEAFDAAKTESA